MPSVRSDQAIEVRGLDEFRKQLRALGPTWPKALGQANKSAAELVAEAARGRAMSLGGVAAKTPVKASAQARAAVVQLGTNSTPWALGAEFGAKQYPQFKPWRGNQWVESGNEGVGYFLHPAIQASMDKVQDVYMDALIALAHAAFPD